MQYAASTASDRSLPRHFANSYGLCRYHVANKGCVDISGRCYACTLTEESSRLRASASLYVKIRVCIWTTVCIRTTVLREAQSQN